MARPRIFAKMTMINTGYSKYYMHTILYVILILLVYRCFNTGSDQSKRKLIKEMSMYTAKDIYQHLDSASKDYRFLYMNDGYFLPCKARMNLYADDKRWAIVIEKAGYHNRMLNAQIQLLYFGNCLKNLPLLNGKMVNLETIVISGEDDLRKLSGSDEDDFELVSAGIDSVKIRESVLKIEKDISVYNKMDIEVINYDNPQGLIDFIAMLRLISIKHPALFHATDSEIRTHIPSDIPLILAIDDWYHEDTALPSTVESYRMAAEVITKKNANLWEIKHKPNMHWKYWKEAGEL